MSVLVYNIVIYVHNILRMNHSVSLSTVYSVFFFISVQQCCSMRALLVLMFFNRCYYQPFITVMIIIKNGFISRFKSRPTRRACMHAYSQTFVVDNIQFHRTLYPAATASYVVYVVELQTRNAVTNLKTKSSEFTESV